MTNSLTNSLANLQTVVKGLTDSGLLGEWSALLRGLLRYRSTRAWRRKTLADLDRLLASGCDDEAARRVDELYVLVTLRSADTHYRDMLMSFVLATDCTVTALDQRRRCLDDAESHFESAQRCFRDAEAVAYWWGGRWPTGAQFWGLFCYLEDTARRRNLPKLDRDYQTRHWYYGSKKSKAEPYRRIQKVEVVP